MDKNKILVRFIPVFQRDPKPPFRTQEREKHENRKKKYTNMIGMHM
jgi:hypothetical protein